MTEITMETFDRLAHEAAEREQNLLSEVYKFMCEQQREIDAITPILTTNRNAAKYRMVN